MYPQTYNSKIQAGVRNFSHVFDLLDQVDIRRIEHSDDVEDLQRFRYKCYHSKGFMDYREDGICTDRFDAEENTSLFGIYKEGSLVSSIRVHHLNQENRVSPSSNTFSDVFEPLLDDGISFIDSSRFTVDQSANVDLKCLHFVTMRIAVLACIYHNVDYSLSLIRPAHAAFYQRYFGFKRWGEVRKYPGLNFEVTQFACNIRETADQVLQRMPFMHSLPTERKLMFDREASQQCCFNVKTTAKMSVDSVLRAIQMPKIVNPALVAA